MVDDAEREFFAAHGWLIVRGAVPPARVAELERALDDVIPEPSYRSGWAGRVVEVAGISAASTEIARHARDAGVGRLAARALGARRVRLLQDTALVKPAAGGPIEWHQDYSYLAYLDRPAVVTVRLALTACTVDNGCMRVIDGSHAWGPRGADLSFRRTHIEDALGALPDALREHARRAEAPLELEPGDLSLHHCLTFHASGVNRSARPRKTLVVRLMDAACRLEPARLPSPEAAARFTVDGAGHLTDPGFPVVYDDDAPAGA